MTGVIVRSGMISWWLTINPSDLRNPVILRLGGVEFASDALPQATAAVIRATATSNSVAVAQFFHYTCCALFDGLLGSNSKHMGILGDISNHYGVVHVESNGRGMLHLHALLWAKGNVGFANIRDRVLNIDSAFAARMIAFLESTIVQGIDTTLGMPPSIPNRPEHFSTHEETDDSFHERLTADSNAVAAKVQKHSPTHSSTCFKYGRRSSCRFNYPRKLAPTSYVDEHGVIHVARHDPWTTPWNKAIAIANCIRSNHDISSIPTVSKSLSLTYYITNCTQRRTISPHNKCCSELHS